MLDFKIWPTFPDEKSDKANQKFYLCLLFNVNAVYYNNLMSTKVPEEAEMKLIPLEKRDFLGEKKQSDKYVLITRGLM